MYNYGTNQAYIQSLLLIFKVIQRVHKSFESNNADPTKLVGDITLLLNSLIKEIIVPTSNVDPLEGSIENTLDPKPHLGYKLEKRVKLLKKNYSADQEKALRRRCITFATTLAQEIRLRLPNNVKILRKNFPCSVRIHCIIEPLIPQMNCCKCLRMILTTIKSIGRFLLNEVE